FRQHGVDVFLIIGSGPRRRGRRRGRWWRRGLWWRGRRRSRRRRRGTRNLGDGRRLGLWRRLGRSFRPPGIVIRDDAADGGKDFLHRRLLRLRRLTHGLVRLDFAYACSRIVGILAALRRESSSIAFIRQRDAPLAGGKSKALNDLWTEAERNRRASRGYRPSGVRTPAQLSRTCS